MRPWITPANRPRGYFVRVKWGDSQWTCLDDEEALDFQQNAEYGWGKPAWVIYPAFTESEQPIPDDRRAP